MQKQTKTTEPKEITGFIITVTCDLCGHNNSRNGACYHCGGETKEQLIKGRWKTVLTRKPTIPMQGFYNRDVIEVLS